MSKYERNFLLTRSVVGMAKGSVERWLLPLGGALLSLKEWGARSAHYEVNFWKWAFIMKNKIQHLF